MTMSKSRWWTLAALIALVTLTSGGAWAGDEPGATPAKKIKVLVVTGGHGFPVEPFRNVFKGFPDMACTFVEEKEGGEAFDDLGKWDYDAIVLYNYLKKPSEKRQENFLKLMDKGVGLVVLHHAIHGYQAWPEFMKIVGLTSWLGGAKDNVDFKVHVEDPQHPITKGLADFAINDETYRGHGVDPKARVLLTTDEPTNAKPVAWVHTYRKSRVCYYQLGHGTSAYANPQFATILARAIRWTAGRDKSE